MVGSWDDDGRVWYTFLVFLIQERWKNVIPNSALNLEFGCAGASSSPRALHLLRTAKVHRTFSVSPQPNSKFKAEFGIYQKKPRNNFMNSNCDLSNKNCVPCKGGVPPLKGEPLAQLHRQLGGGWQIIDDHYLEKEYVFKNFKEALAFTNELGKIAEQEGHHPDIFLSYGKVKVQLWTHKINGLSESDFILAAKYDAIR